MRIASYNLENLFARPKAMDSREGDAETRRAVLSAHARLSALFELTDYSGVEAEILGLLDTLGLLRSDDSPYVRLRRLRGQLLRRPRTGDVVLVADGRADWVGWAELKTVAVSAGATENTARVIHEVGADVLGVVEADDRPGLQMFNDSVLPSVAGTPYEQVMLVDGNDLRGIDVGVMARASHRLVQIRTHVFDDDGQGTVFSRDCCEYHFDTPLGNRLVVLVNHFKSKGYSSPGDPVGAKRRRRQAVRVAQVVASLRREGIVHVAVVGDLNDDPASESLQPLLAHAGLTDVSEHEDFDWNHRRGTYGSGNEDDKIDYVLLSEPLYARVVGGGVFRKGVWRGPRTEDPWDIFPSMHSRTDEASDHAAVYADLLDV
jgi:endonuclease/exonuclease/phosphatase family metal-dependent hydrolase